jgi:hypothetical protein
VQPCLGCTCPENEGGVYDSQENIHRLEYSLILIDYKMVYRPSYLRVFGLPLFIKGAVLLFEREKKLICKSV